MESSEDIQLLYPKSLYPSFEFQQPVVDEQQALMDLIANDASDTQDEDTFEELEIHNFSVYQELSHKKGFNGQFESPHVVYSQLESAVFYLDGVLLDGSPKRLVGAVIYDVNIGGLNDPGIHTSVH